MLRFASYIRAQSAQEAFELLQKKKGSKIVGGGLWLRLSARTIPCAIDLSACGLDRIEETEDAFIIGSMVSLRALETHAAFTEATCGVLADAVRDVVGVQFREMARVGGSVFGRFGFSDVLCALLPLDCEVELVGAGRMPLAEFAASPYERDVLTHVIVRKHDYRAGYACVRRTATDFAVLNCAAAWWEDAWHVAMGARPARARLLAGAEQTRLTEARPSRDELAALAGVLQELPMSSNLWGSAAYRRKLAGVLGTRAVGAACAFCSDADFSYEVSA